MDHEHWQEVQRLFEGAVEQPPENVDDWLEEQCAGRDSLKAEVKKLLQDDVEAAGLTRTEVGSREPLPVSNLPQFEEPQRPRFGKYEIDQKIGQGGFGIVYRGRDTMLERYVAVKTCSTNDGPLRQRFYREGRIAAGLQHPNVTTVHDLGVEDGVPYLVQEFLVGEDLDHLIERREPLSLVTKLDYLVQIARGLEYAHGAGVLHRDIKPSNVRIQDSGSVKIMDFGIAKLLTDDTAGGLTGTGAALGTVGYLAPEQLRGEEVDVWADIFSFGVLAYELLTYERPFKGANFSQVSYQLLYREPVPLSMLWPQCPEILDEVVGRCLKKDAASRYPSFTALLAELEPLLDSLRSGSAVDPRIPTLVLPSDEVTAMPETTAETAFTPPPHRRPVVVGAIGAALVAMLAISWFWFSRDDAAQQTAQAVDPAPAQIVTSEESPTVGPDSGAVPAEPVPSETSSDEAASPPRAAAPPPAAPPETSVSPAPPPPRVETTPAVEDTPPASEAQGALPTPTETPALDLIDQGSQAPPVEGTPEEIPESEPQPESAEQQPPSATPEEATPEEASPEAADTSDTPSPSEPEAEAVEHGSLFSSGPDVTPPQVLEHPQPTYPEKARRWSREGKVVVRVLVDENGRVIQAIAPTKDRFGFGEAARLAALRALFEPATKQGVAGKMWTEINFDFKLK